MENSIAYEEDYATYELIDGKIVYMSPRPVVRHNIVSSNIFLLFANYLKGKTCTPFADGTDLYLSDRDHYVPDGMIVCDPDKIRADGVHGAPDLVVEVLSPSTARYDRGRKRDVYESCGVKEYWIVNPADKSLEVYLLKEGRLVFHNMLTTYPDFMLAKMTEEERAAIPRSFKTSIFGDLEITMEDVFYRVD